MDTPKHIKSREAVNLKSFSLITCKHVIRKQLVNHQSFNKKSSSLY